MAQLENKVLSKAFDEVSSFFQQYSNETIQESTEDSGVTTEDSFFQDTFFHPTLIQDSEPCKAILHYHLGNSNLRAWDLIIFIPNIAFLLFLFYKLPNTRIKLRATNCYLFSTLYVLVVTCSLVSALRCLLSMIIHLDNVQNDMADKGVWVTSRFILLAAELSVAGFGAAFGLRDNKQNIQRLVLGCSMVSFVICAIQAYLEIFQPFYGFQVSTGFHLYGHGGPIYWAVTSSLMAILYLLLLSTLLCPSMFLPTMLAHSHNFFIYSATQFALHSVTAAGAIMLSTNIHPGLCLTNMTSFITFSLLSPLIFACFLHNWFSTSQPSLLFAYKAQLDDMEDDDATLQTSTNIKVFREEAPDTPATFVSGPLDNPSN